MASKQKRWGWFLVSGEFIRDDLLKQMLTAMKGTVVKSRIDIDGNGDDVFQVVVECADFDCLATSWADIPRMEAKFSIVTKDETVCHVEVTSDKREIPIGIYETDGVSVLERTQRKLEELTNAGTTG